MEKQKSKFVKSLQKVIQGSLPNKSNSPSRDKSLEEGTIEKIKKDPLKLTQKHRNPFIRQYIQRQLNYCHVYNFYNLGGVNEISLREKENDESFLRTMFYIFSIERIEIKYEVVIMHLKNNPCNYIPIEYMIKRYESFGDQGFYDIACKMQQINTFINLLTEQKSDPIKDKSDYVTKFIQIMQGKTYICKILGKHLLISKTLLHLLGYDIDLFCIRAAKYEAILEEFLSAENYQSLTLKFFENIQWINQFVKSNISKEEFEAFTTLQFNDFLRGSQQKKIYCKMKRSFPLPSASCLEVMEVYFESVDFEVSNSSSSKMKKKLRKQMNQIQASELKSVEFIRLIPENMQQANEGKTACYEYK